MKRPPVGSKDENSLETKDEPTSLSHLDEEGHARMVDVGEKQDTRRRAVALARISMRAETLEVIEEGRAKKGDVLAAARIAGIMAAKRTSDLVPLCHPILLTHVSVDLEPHHAPNDGEAEAEIVIRATCESVGPTGVEMEALTAVSVAGLTLYDMCKAIDRGMVIREVMLQEKEGGRSGPWKRG